MQIMDFPEVTVVIAKDQPQYRPLPAHRHGDQKGRITCCWKLTWKERIRVLFSGVIWHQILTFKQPLQPQLLMVEKPDMSRSPADKCETSPIGDCVKVERAA